MPASSDETFEQAIDVTDNATILVNFAFPITENFIKISTFSTHTREAEVHFSWLAPIAWLTTIAVIAESLKAESLVIGDVSLDKTGHAVRAKGRKNNPLKVQVAP